MPQLGKMIVLMGLVLVLVGGVIWALGKTGFRGLPGDIRYDSPNAHFYFPIATCLVISALLTFGMWLWRWLSRGQ
jgi:hypothetical protein